MQKTLLRLILGATAFISPVIAGDWAPIPPEVWAMKEDPTKGINGAVILEKRVSFGVKFTEVWVRVRILGEEGKGAASIPASRNLGEVEGRTVQSDGRITSFDGDKDLVSASVEFRGKESKVETVLPPGLTGNCLVDLHYRLDTYFRNAWVEIPVLERYPIRKKVMELATPPTFALAMYGFKDLKLPKVSVGSMDAYTFENLPAEVQEPYSLGSVGEHPQFLYYKQPPLLRMAASQGPNVYWKEVGRLFIQDSYGKSLIQGPVYQAWSRAVRAGLAGDPISRATAILRRLEDSINNNSNLTKAEWAALPKQQAAELMHPHNLEESVVRRHTTNIGLHYLAYQLLADEGLDPKVLLVTDRDLRSFKYWLPNVYQFTDTLLGVASPSGGIAWFDPSRRFFPIGVIHPDYQGTQGLLVDPKDWSSKPYSVPIQPPTTNRSSMEYRIELGEEDHFKVRAAFKGYPEFEERLRYYTSEPQEQNRKLKDAFESRLKGFELFNASVEHAQETGKSLEWTIEGRKEAEEGRRRSISPFPGMAYPLDVPASWPETRKNPIVIPYCREFSATAQITVPKGWRLTLDSDLEEWNEFGKVTWRSMQTNSEKGTEVVVVFTVEAKQMFTSPVSYESFKKYIGWVEKAGRRTVLLERQS